MKQKEEEPFVVSGSDAVVDPRAMVVKPFYAFVTDCTVTGAFSPDNLTVRAQRHSIKLLK